MNRAVMAAGIAALTLASVSTGHAQQQIEWKQVLNLPKGLNQPKGVSVDILGIELGATYTEAKAKLEKLAAEYAPAAKPQAPPAPSGPISQGQADAMRLGALEGLERQQNDQMSGVSNRPPVTEVKTQFRLPVPGGFLTASYVGKIEMERYVPSSTADKIRESYTVYLSAPSSGHQVIGIKRYVTYRNNADQPRASDVIAKLSEKLRAQPQVYQVLYRFQFNDGRAYVPPQANRMSCQIGMGATSAEGANNANKTGDCDIVLDVTAERGISNEHVSRFIFELSDNERTRQNVVADFAYFGEAMRGVQSQTKGVAPKL